MNLNVAVRLFLAVAVHGLTGGLPLRSRALIHDASGLIDSLR